jgi:hypothetical protein
MSFSRTEYISVEPSQADIRVDVSEFRIEKRRAEAALTLSTGTTVRGCFFLSESRASHAGPERVVDLLNAEEGFFPFELNGQPPNTTVVYNRSQVVMVTLLGETIEAQLEPSYAVAPVRAVRILLSSGETLDGSVRVYCPSGHDRLSDYARLPEPFRYIETKGATIIVNSAHIVELRESSEA